MHFKCKSGDCILTKYVCDGVLDCFDNSDENNCSEEELALLNIVNNHSQVGTKCGHY